MNFCEYYKKKRTEKQTKLPGSLLPGSPLPGSSILNNYYDYDREVLGVGLSKWRLVQVSLNSDFELYF